MRTRPHDFAGQANHVQRALHSVQNDIDKKQSQIGKGAQASSNQVYLQNFNDRMSGREPDKKRQQQKVKDAVP